jgi:hypothetical protein
MHAELLRSLLSPLRLWRTIFLMIAMDSTVARFSQDAFAVLCSSVACAFVFSAFERREWIVMPAHVYAGDIAARISLAFAVTLFVCTFQLAASA